LKEGMFGLEISLAHSRVYAVAAAVALKQSRSYK